MCRYLTANESINDRMNTLYNQLLHTIMLTRLLKNTFAACNFARTFYTNFWEALIQFEQVG